MPRSASPSDRTSTRRRLTVRIAGAVAGLGLIAAGIFGAGAVRDGIFSPSTDSAGIFSPSTSSDSGIFQAGIFGPSTQSGIFRANPSDSGIF